MAYDGPTMSVKEFREFGGIQEINRLLLHPMGLALEVIIDSKTGEERIERLWDIRDDPEGWFFEKGVINPDKAYRFALETERHASARVQKLGYGVQPIEGPE